MCCRNQIIFFFFFKNLSALCCLQKCIQEKDLVIWMEYPVSLSKSATVCFVERGQSRGVQLLWEAMSRRALRLSLLKTQFSLIRGAPGGNSPLGLMVLAMMAATVPSSIADVISLEGGTLEKKRLLKCSPLISRPCLSLRRLCSTSL